MLQPPTARNEEVATAAPLHDVSHVCIGTSLSIAMSLSVELSNSEKARKPISLLKATEASDRLFKWKTESDAKIRVRTQKQQEAQEQEEARILSRASQQLPCEQINAAAKRNFEVASEIQWRKLRLRTQNEQLQMEEEARECTFRPRRIAKQLPKDANVQPRYLLPPSSSKVLSERSKAIDTKRKATALSIRKSHQRSTIKNNEQPSVFERLYCQGPRHQTSQTERDAGCSTEGRFHHHQKEHLSAEQLTDFVARLAQDEAKRRASRSNLEVKLTPPFAPTLSARTQEIGAALRRRSLDEILQKEREKRQRKLLKRIGEQHSAGLSRATPSKENLQPAETPMHASREDESSSPLERMIKELLMQEARMRALENTASN